MTTILLIRHGVNDSVGKHLAGRTPGVHLNEEGKKQALELAKLLKDFPVKAIYSSPLERTLETAEPVSEAVGVPVQVHNGLIEADYGDWHGKSFEELHKLDLWRELLREPAAVRFPNGESLQEIQARAAGAVEEIAARFEKDDLVLCFTHGDIIRLATAYFICLPLNEYQHLVTNPAAITELRFYEDRAFLVRYNQCLKLSASQYCNTEAVKAG